MPVQTYSAKTFSAKVLEVATKHHHSVFDALMDIQASESIDARDIPSLLTPQLKKLLERELHDRHLLKKSRR